MNRAVKISLQIATDCKLVIELVCLPHFLSNVLSTLRRVLDGLKTFPGRFLPEKKLRVRRIFLLHGNFQFMTASAFQLSAALPRPLFLCTKVLAYSFLRDFWPFFLQRNSYKHKFMRGIFMLCRSIGFATPFRAAMFLSMLFSGLFFNCRVCFGLQRKGKIVSCQSLNDEQ